VIYNTVRKITNTSFHTQILGASRSLCALGLILTLLTNSYSTFFPIIDGEYLPSLFAFGSEFNSFNFFSLFGFDRPLLSKVIALSILSLVLYGWRPRYTCIPHWWVTYSFFTSSSVVDGGDHMAAVFTLMLIPICLLDSRRSHWTNSLDTKASIQNKLTRIFCFFNILIIQLQTSAIYLHSATGKLLVDDWVNGTAVYYWFNHTFFSMPYYLHCLISYALDSSFGVVIITWGVILFEFILAGAILMNSESKKKLFPFAILFHISIIFIHGIFSFFFSIGAFLILYLIPLNLRIPIENQG